MAKGKSPLAKEGQLWFTYSVSSMDEVSILVEVQADSLKQANKRLPREIERQLGMDADTDQMVVQHVFQGKIEEVKLTAKELEDILS